MVKKRLARFIEFENFFINSQCGFRSQKSTMDHASDWKPQRQMPQNNISYQFLRLKEDVRGHQEIWCNETI